MLKRSTTILPLHRLRRLRPQGQLIPSIVTQIIWIFVSQFQYCQGVSWLRLQCRTWSLYQCQKLKNVRNPTHSFCIGLEES